MRTLCLGQDAFMDPESFLGEEMWVDHDMVQEPQ